MAPSQLRTALREAALLKAKHRAVRLYPDSVPFRNTYIRGARAKLEGHAESECPYPAVGTSWRRAYRAAWLHGFHSVPA